ncbi:hypothetical protein DOJK_02301 [Patescibacteria group bacterium]|nr:hypothetical protein DOJK_02301 [Patescibacteria group bacterium]
MNKQTGLALILVLWVLSLLTIMAGSFITSIRRETAMLSALKDTAAATALAESGIQLAQFMLLTEGNKRWHTDGSIYQITTKNAVLRIRLLSEAGKINLNSADQAMLQKLFSHSPTGIEATLPFGRINRATALLDWRDSDEFVRLNGAEQQQYQDAQLDYSPSNKNLQSLAELPMILGMDEKTLTWIEPLVTIYGQQANVDLQQASKEVLQLFLDNPNLVEQYIKLRTENTKQDLPPPIPPIASAGLSQTSILDAITVISEVHQHDSVAIIQAVIKKTVNQTNTPFQLLSWQRNNPHHHSLFADDMNALIVKHYAESELDN